MPIPVVKMKLSSKVELQYILRLASSSGSHTTRRGFVEGFSEAFVGLSGLLLSTTVEALSATDAASSAQVVCAAAAAVLVASCERRGSDLFVKDPDEFVAFVSSSILTGSVKGVGSA